MSRESGLVAHRLVGENVGQETRCVSEGKVPHWRIELTGSRQRLMALDAKSW